MLAWGETMRKMYNTQRPTDFTTEWLGFSTDNGAYYYYGWNQSYPSGAHTTYQDALLGVHDYSMKEDIPYKSILLDSWWYTKGAGGGLKEWDATNSTFPDGLKSFADKTGWKFQMHSRHWSPDNVYSKVNGGQYKFLTELCSTGECPGGSSETVGMAMPLEQKFWDDLISNKTENGIPLAVYEQDWLYNEWQGLAAVRASPTLARQWLMQMGKGAAKQNATIQYCMSLSRMVLQTLEVSEVTTFRASDDYHPGQTGYYKGYQGDPTGTKGCSFPYCVYYQGTTAIIGEALAIKPSKDNYWSTNARQRGSFCDKPAGTEHCREPYSEMQSAISSYTTAQVAPADGIGYSNASLIKMACRSDGRLLQPSAAARAIDASFALSGGPEARVSNVHAIMSTHSDVDGAPTMRWAHALVIGLNKSFALTPAHLGADLAGPSTDPELKHVVWSGVHSPSAVAEFSAAEPLSVPACMYSDFGLYHVAPVAPKSSAAYLGELGKWVPVASARTVSVTDSAAGLAVGIIGVAHEKVELAFYDTKSTKATSVLCTIGAAGTATATFAAGAGKCA